MPKTIESLSQICVADSASLTSVCLAQLASLGEIAQNNGHQTVQCHECATSYQYIEQFLSRRGLLVKLSLLVLFSVLVRGEPLNSRIQIWRQETRNIILLYDKTYFDILNYLGWINCVTDRQTDRIATAIATTNVVRKNVKCSVQYCIYYMYTFLFTEIVIT